MGMLVFLGGTAQLTTISNLNLELKLCLPLAGSRAFIAASKGKSIAFLNIGRQTIMKHECHAALADISSIVFDSLNSVYYMLHPSMAKYLLF